MSFYVESRRSTCPLWIQSTHKTLEAWAGWLQNLQYRLWYFFFGILYDEWHCSDSDNRFRSSSFILESDVSIRDPFDILEPAFESSYQQRAREIDVQVIMIYLLLGVNESAGFIFERNYLVRISLGIIRCLLLTSGCFFQYISTVSPLLWQFEHRRKFLWYFTLAVNSLLMLSSERLESIILE